MLVRTRRIGDLCVRWGPMSFFYDLLVVVTSSYRKNLDGSQILFKIHTVCVWVCVGVGMCVCVLDWVFVSLCVFYVYVSVCMFVFLSVCMILCDSVKVWQTAYMAAPWELLFVMSTILEEGLEPRPSMINVFIPSQHTEAGTRVWDDPQPCDWGSGSVGGWVAERDTRCVQAKGFKPNNPRRVRSKASSHSVMVKVTIQIPKLGSKTLLVVHRLDALFYLLCE